MGCGASISITIDYDVRKMVTKLCPEKIVDNLYLENFMRRIVSDKICAGKFVGNLCPEKLFRKFFQKSVPGKIGA